MTHDDDITGPLDDGEIVRVARIVLDVLKLEPDLDTRIAIAALIRVATAIMPHIACPACRAAVCNTARAALAATTLGASNEHVH
jgi:hypothetical protein